MASMNDKLRANMGGRGVEKGKGRGTNGVEGDFPDKGGKRKK